MTARHTQEIIVPWGIRFMGHVPVGGKILMSSSPHRCTAGVRGIPGVIIRVKIQKKIVNNMYKGL